MDTLHQFWVRFGPQTEMAYFTAQTMLRLVLAAFLGGVIGLERELRRKPAGLRTNMFICFGAAMFTILSWKLAGDYTGDHTRIAAQIIPGIGFIGAGSILHAKQSVTGLTTAATIFVVASIGMAAGGGLYIPAIFATLLLLVSLTALGLVEKRYSLKEVAMAYEIQGADAQEIMTSVSSILEEYRRMMQTVQIGRSNSHYRVQFTVLATQRMQEDLFARFRLISQATRVESLGYADVE